MLAIVRHCYRRRPSSLINRGHSSLIGLMGSGFSFLPPVFPQPSLFVGEKVLLLLTVSITVAVQPDTERRQDPTLGVGTCDWFT